MGFGGTSEGKEVEYRHRNQSVARMLMSQPSFCRCSCSRGSLTAMSSCTGQQGQFRLAQCTLYGQEISAVHASSKEHQLAGLWSACVWHLPKKGKRVLLAY